MKTVDYWPKSHGGILLHITWNKIPSQKEDVYSVVNLSAYERRWTALWMEFYISFNGITAVKPTSSLLHWEQLGCGWYRYREVCLIGIQWHDSYHSPVISPSATWHRNIWISINSIVLGANMTLMDKFHTVQTILPTVHPPEGIRT